MPPSHLDTIRRHCLPLEPVPTTAEPKLKSLRGVRAVFFDVYGTLFISASGDVGTASAERRAEAFRDALLAVGLQLSAPEDVEQQQAAANQLIASIQDAHQQSQALGVDCPEVDIVSIWDETLQRLSGAGLLARAHQDVDLESLAVHYEVRTNPTWPMPGADTCLKELKVRGQRLGIVSNAQFFTRELFPALLGQTTDTLGFDPRFMFYSYQWGRAKPGPDLYRLAAKALSAAGTPASDVLYIGNDMLNDVAAASEVGFRTALFAGDSRSLRLRREDARVAGVEPDLVFTHLSQVIDCIE